VHQLVAEVSLGQRARVSLAKLLVSAHNVLVLDEPTNHLDIRSREKIEEALQDYPGALVLVSHDRYFLDKVVNQVYHLDNRRLTLYLGNYSQFAAQRQADPVAAARRRQETILRTRLAALAARLASLSPEDAEYSELDEEYRQVTSQLRQVSE
jgi:ATPase subunit of ABC transporter with duplicated ATPase domains